MSKFSGRIGYEHMRESSPGVWTPCTTVKTVYGDVTKQSRRLESGQQVNDNINISNQFSIVADPFALNHMHEMKWIEWYGTKWKINDVTVNYPRLDLTIGGVYNDGHSQD